MDVSGGLSLVQFIIEKLGSPIWAHIEALLGLECELDKLRQTMSTIEAVLLDAEVEERLHQAYRTYVERNKLQRLKEALYRADDLFDEITTLAHLNKLMSCNSNKVCNEVCLFFSCSNQFRSAFTWSQEMKKISEMLDDIVKDHRYDIGSRHPAGFDAAKQMRIDRETHSYVCEDDVMIGREDDKRKVIDMLLNTPVEQQDGFVVSIVGIGGLGKTTLARQVYNDEMIVKEFPRKLWVCVSDDFNVKALVGQILAAVNPLIKLDQMTLEDLQTKLRKELDGKRYLLVLDDVWNEDSNKWLELRNVLSGRISAFVVTTRSKRVAEVVGSCYTHPLRGLSDDESWNLFQRMAFKQGQHQMEANLVDIGKKIVRKCANVPLAIRVVGSLLRGQDESRWQNLEKTYLASVLQDESNGILPMLKISYYYLPFHLKSCFSYCAVFPKDYRFIKEDLICLWMAQGFIIPSDEESFEDVGDKYFEQLLQRCFFQDVERAEDTEEIISCKMHDLIHDLAKEVAGTDILSCTYSPRCFNEKARHVHIDGSTPEDVVGKLSNMQRMRTFLCTKDPDFSLKPFVGGVSKVKYLRVLLLNDCRESYRLPSGIGELVHLRYLDLSHNRYLCVLPSSITKLYNLQTLKLCDCENLKGLPRELGKLVNLRHLDIDGCSSLTHMPPGMNSMTSLQKLTMFVVGGSATSNAASSSRSTGGAGQLEDLDGFTNYTRTMQIIIKKNVRYNAVVGRAMLLKSPKLLEIKYKWVTGENNNAEEMLQGLQPCSNLRKLRLSYYPEVRLPNWMMTFSCLPNLVEIVICGCERLEQLPLMMSQLRHLKVLKFEGLSKVEYVESSSSSNINSRDEDEDELVFFPSLEELKLEKMEKLKGWWKPSSSESGESDQIPQAPLLSKLYVSDCPNLTTLFLGTSMNLKSCLPNLAEIEIRNCERLEHLPMMSQLRHLKVLEFEGLNEVEYMECSSINSGDDNELEFFPSLEKLCLEDMPKLKGWWKPSSESESEESETPQAPKLSHLDIRSCPELTTFPLCPGLQQLVLRDFNEALGPIIRETTQQKEEERHGSLREVTTDNLPYLINSLPIRSFHHLSHLRISFDQKMEELKTGEVGEVFRSGCLSSLRSLAITSCNNLKSISGRGVWYQFTALESLALDSLPELELEDEDDVINNKSTEEGSDAEMPWRYLAPILRSLTLWRLPKMVNLPKGIGCLSSLQSLDIVICNNLESLTPSIGGLSSLQSLVIWLCPKLKRMPEEMRHLTSLTKLHLCECSPELMNECYNKNGANWSNIQHIPNIKLDWN